jgi:hypothetical protein
MPLADYAHWNEDAEFMWWHEEGKHVEEPDYGDPHDDLREYDAEQAYADEIGECDTAELKRMIADHEVSRREQNVIEHELRERGEL